MHWYTHAFLVCSQLTSPNCFTIHHWLTVHYSLHTHTCGSLMKLAFKGCAHTHTHTHTHHMVGYMCSKWSEFACTCVNVSLCVCVCVCVCHDCPCYLSNTSLLWRCCSGLVHLSCQWSCFLALDSDVGMLSH